MIKGKMGLEMQTLIIVIILVLLLVVALSWNHGLKDSLMGIMEAIKNVFRIRGA